MSKDSIARVLVSAFAVSCCLTLAACNENEDPVDDTADAVRDASEDAADEIEDATN